MAATVYTNRFPYWMAILPLTCCLLCVPVRAQGGDDIRGDLAWQIALDRESFSPGVIDGKPGAKTALATREYQRAHGLAGTGTLDAATASALQVNPGSALGTYTVDAGDVSAVGPAPKSWLAKSQLQYLGYESVVAGVAEKFHCSQNLLARLNPGVSLARLKAGDKVIVPAVQQSQAMPAGTRVEINLSEKVIRVFGGQNQLVGLFHCSIAAKASKRPNGPARVVMIAPNPTYLFKPSMYPEVKNINHELTIPPGPRNPVGLCWIGLNLPGYGMHGTPNPEMIGKTGSHGCFRLANWDAVRLGRMIHVNTPVQIYTRTPAAPTAPRPGAGLASATR